MIGTEDAPFDVFAPQWGSPTVAQVAGISQPVLSGWRDRHGFLGGTKPGQQGPGYQHSLVDVLVVVAVAQMVRRGLDVANAISAEPELTAAFADMLINGEIASPIFGFHAKGRDPGIEASFYHIDRTQTVGEVLAKSPTGSMQMLDLQRVIDHVLKALKVKLEKVVP